MPYFEADAELLEARRIDDHPRAGYTAPRRRSRRSGMGCAKGGRHPHTLPPEALGPFFNDEFGDVFARSTPSPGDGFTLSELRDKVRGCAAGAAAPQ